MTRCRYCVWFCDHSPDARFCSVRFTDGGPTHTDTFGRRQRVAVTVTPDTPACPQFYPNPHTDREVARS